MAMEYMLLSITSLWDNREDASSTSRLDAKGFVGGEQTFARSDDQLPGDTYAQRIENRAVWNWSFISRVVDELGDDDWSIIFNTPLEVPCHFIFSRPR